MRLKFISILSLLLLVTACGTSSTTSQYPTGAPGAIGDRVGSVVVGSQRDLAVNVGDRVFFDTDRHSLKSEARDVLRRQAAFLKRHSGLDVTVEGHADERGTREYNLALGERRANSVKNFLVSQGVKSSRVRVVSFGKERPAVLGSNPAAWAQNRRSVTLVSE